MLDSAIPKDLDKWTQKTVFEANQAEFNKVKQALLDQDPKMVDYLKTINEDEVYELYNQLLIKNLKAKKETAGRSDDFVFMKTCGLAKADLRF